MKLSLLHPIVPYFGLWASLHQTDTNVRHFMFHVLHFCFFVFCVSKTLRLGNRNESFSLSFTYLNTHIHTRAPYAVTNSSCVSVLCCVVS